MEDGMFRVVVSGRTVPGTSAEQAVANFAATFRVSIERAQSLIGRRAVVRRDVDEKTATAFVAALQKAGLEAFFEPSSDLPAAEQCIQGCLTSAASQVAGAVNDLSHGGSPLPLRPLEPPPIPAKNDTEAARFVTSIPPPLPQSAPHVGQYDLDATPAVAPPSAPPPRNYCSRCGAATRVQDHYCTSCGTVLRPVQASGKEIPPASTTARSTQPVSLPQPDNDATLVRRIADYEKLSGIFWMILGGIQVVSVIGIIAGAWNLLAGYSRIKIAPVILARDPSVPGAFEGIAQLVIIAVINLFLGGVIGLIFVGFDFFIRDMVLSHRRLFEVANEHDGGGAKRVLPNVLARGAQATSF